MPSNHPTKKIPTKLLIILFILAVLSISILSFAGAFRVSEVIVTGNEYYTKEEIVDFVLGEDLQNSLYLYLRYQYREHPTIPFIDTFEVKLNSPHSISIRVYEKGIVGYVRYLGKNVYFDKDGIVVESTDELMEGIPMISGLSFNQLILYQSLNVQDTDIFNMILNITQILKKYNLNPDEIRFRGITELSLKMDEVQVALGTVEHMDEKIARIKQLEGDLEGKSGTLHMENYTNESTHISLEAVR